MTTRVSTNPSVVDQRIYFKPRPEAVFTHTQIYKSEMGALMTFGPAPDISP